MRKDYDVLVGTNRHTITPHGWVQEENNLKVALAGRRLARTGVRRGALRAHPRLRLQARVRRTTRATEPFWAEVRVAWRELEERAGRFSMRAPSDQAQLFLPFFEYAAKLEDGAAFDREEARAFVRRTLQSTYLR